MKSRAAFFIIFCSLLSLSIPIATSAIWGFPGKPLEVEFLSPKEGTRVHGKISIEARVNHPEQVKFIDFYIQEPGAKDRYSWQAYSPPYVWGGDGQKLDTTIFADGAASAVAFCYSENGSKPTAEKRVHFIIDNGKPIVKILSPKDGDIVGGNIMVTIEASDPKGLTRSPGIERVLLYLDGSPYQEMRRGPFHVAMSTCLLSPGLHSIKAVAEDSEGLTSSYNIVVNVTPGQTAVMK